MPTFITDVLQDLKSKHLDFSEIIFVLPSKRAGVFLKSQLHNYIEKTSFSPSIQSIEDFVQDLSQLKQVKGIELLFQFYDSYKTITPEENIEPFDSFSKWAQVLIQDFNEIDRYLISSNAIFDYLGAIQELNHWSLQENKTELTSNYLTFWQSLNTYYNQFVNDLIKKESAYQGLIYREATEHIEAYIQNTNKTHVFLGFNALNTAEERIIQELLQNNLAYIYWNIDSHFINDQIHSAGYFARQHKQNWSFYRQNDFNWTSSVYREEKNINVIGCPKSVGQSKYVGHLITTLLQQSQGLNNTAIVLGDETLLTPMLNSLPNGIEAVNVTMGLTLKSVPLAALFEELFRMHKLNSKRYYFKDIINILSNQMTQYLLVSSDKIIQSIRHNNITYLTADELLNLADDSDINVLSLLFGDWETSISNNIKNCLKLIFKIKNTLDHLKSKKHLELEYLYRFNVLFNELANLNTTYGYIKDVSTLHSVYKELLNTETLDFQGEPLDGLQIMGMLESRVLDFETVIITSVNEGILPGGKTNNSFIPFDVKIENNLPTFKEKDAVYTYHFYSLIQRAKNIYLLYNTEVDALKGGEKSRFITQLEVEGIHDIKHKIVSPNVPKIEETLTIVKKTNDVVERLKEIAAKGFSPSSLTNYIRNPIDFYFEKVLGVKNAEEVEETVAANTLGTVIHNTLEDFYKPLEGKHLTLSHLESMKGLIDKTIAHHFAATYKKGDITKGKNLISFEIAKRYISNFLTTEIEVLKAGNSIKIIAIEVESHVSIDIPEIAFPVTITGKVDRVDELNGKIRVIDYKSGKVEQHMVEIVDWDLLNTDYDKYSKSFQILCYAYMLTQQDIVQFPLEAGIISFKNLKQGLLKFAEKESVYSRKKNHLISEETLQNFETQLKSLIIEICNPDIDFTEKELR
ncbi:PD-(D/E)XK nuclease family protein [Winogradskyella haliclonae]|uniref:PD-(D/E)XK endonuclease-like domain-containing protein n=1 Tax=Winogradskyella haliclonae TaxID=2048558 RepID=A0ABQ2BWM4_9FLAO|nr:PD-(D/E)XK nuclease family protein [Winogradskyella haliclonae]GGI56167.1 hypothetical protein GCM10011444_04760 [Winogradskyella haliclonae]